MQHVQTELPYNTAHTACARWKPGTFCWCHTACRFKPTVTSQLAVSPPPVGRHLVPEIKKSRRESPAVRCGAELSARSRAEQVQHEAPLLPSGERRTDLMDTPPFLFLVTAVTGP